MFSKGVTQFRLVESLGATEAYPFTGSAELITDITSTGETLKANNLRILKDGKILKSEACLLTYKKKCKRKYFEYWFRHFLSYIRVSWSKSPKKVKILKKTQF